MYVLIDSALPCPALRCPALSHSQLHLVQTDVCLGLKMSTPQRPYTET